MLVRHLLVGTMAGFLAGLVSIWAGFSVWATVGVYILTANLGLLASALVGLIGWPRWSAKMARELRGTASDPVGVSPAE
jgi:hypothetical protein